VPRHRKRGQAVAADEGRVIRQLGLNLKVNVNMHVDGWGSTNDVLHD